MKSLSRLLKFVIQFGLICKVLSGNDSNLKSGLMVVSSEQTDADGEGDKDVEIVKDFEIDDEDLEVFQPTSAWQAIGQRQAVPAGLHVRINLQTGMKEAKLMDGDDGSKYKQVKEPRKKFVKVDRNLVSKQNLKAALKEFRDKFHDDPEGESSETPQLNVAKNFRSIEEIRQELEGSEIFVKKDIEMITKHVNVLNNSHSSLEEVQHALDELEYYVHQIDNGRDLDTIGGLALVTRFMNSSEESLRRRAAFVVGSAVQSNPHVQKAAMNYGALPLVLRLLSSQEPLAVRRKAMYALSALVRLFPKGQQRFLQLSGLESLVRLFNEPGTGPLRVKAITLLTDLLVEQTSFVKLQLEKEGKHVSEAALVKVPLLKAMVDQGWCQLVVSVLSETTDNDIREKVLQALHVMISGCKEKFMKSEIYTTLDQLRTEWQKDASPDFSEENEYAIVLSQLVNDLMSKLD